MSETPTPNDMPKVDAPEPMQEAPEAPAEPAFSPEDAAELARLRKIHSDESKWEKRAKQNFDDAQRFRELAEQLGGKETKEFNPKAAIDALNAKLEAAEAARTRSDVARELGVAPEFVVGATEDDMRVSAQRYLDAVNAAIENALKAKAPAAPPASTVTSNGKITGPDQITSREELAKLSPTDRAKAYEEGRLDSLMGKT